MCDEGRGSREGLPSFKNGTYLITDVCNFLKREMTVLSYRHGIKMPVTLGVLMAVKGYTNDIYTNLKVDEGVSGRGLCG